MPTSQTFVFKEFCLMRLKKNKSRVTKIPECWMRSQGRCCLKVHAYCKIPKSRKSWSSLTYRLIRNSAWTNYSASARSTSWLRGFLRTQWNHSLSCATISLLSQQWSSNIHSSRYCRMLKLKISSWIQSPIIGTTGKMQEFKLCFLKQK